MTEVAGNGKPDTPQVMAAVPIGGLDPNGANNAVRATIAKYTFIIWMTSIIALVLIVFVFGFMAFRTSGDGRASLLGIAGTALGAFVGLLAPSPTGAKPES